MTEVEWRGVGAGGEVFRAAVTAEPGWYWMLRAHQDGPGRYDGSRLIVCLVYVRPDGSLSSPLADLRRVAPEDLIPTDADGRPHPSWFAGPVAPGPRAGSVRVHEGQVQGSLPSPVPGWHWCQTNREAPLIHIDEQEIGPIYVSEVDGAVRVWSAADIHGVPVDVGELGFSEPLVGPGGVIDASGELGRVEATFFGSVAPPPFPEAAVVPVATKCALPRLTLTDGQLHLVVQDLGASRTFYERLGFKLVSQRSDLGRATLSAAGASICLVTRPGPTLRFRGDADAGEALRARGIQPETGPGGLTIRDPDGHTIVID